MSERIVADPAEVATNRTALDISDWVGQGGVDWGDAEIAAYMADMGSYGSIPVDFRVPNRNITVPLMLKQMGGTSFATARENIQAKVALWQQEGGWLKRVTASGTLYCDVVNATLRLPGGWSQAHKNYDTEASLTLEALPDFYGDEQTLSDHAETSAAELIFTETGIDGNYPARVRVVVDEDQGQSQLGLMWGFRSRNYSSASTAALAYEAEALGTLDTAAKAALNGASGGTVVTHGTLSTSWTPVLNLAVGGTAFLTHVGTYRMFARYRTTSGTAVALRSVYDVGDLVYPVENDPWYHPANTGGTAFYVADLGPLTLTQAQVGTHRWAGQIQARGNAGTENVSVDRVWFQPVDESAGILRASVETGLTGFASYSARDSFDQTAGNLTGKTLPVGGTWAGAGDADDFDVHTGTATARRQAMSDSSTDAGRFVTASTPTLTGTVVQVDFKTTDSTLGEFGVVARFGDVNNWIRGSVLANAGVWFGRVRKCTAATAVTLADTGDTIAVRSDYVSIRLEVTAFGSYRLWIWDRGLVMPDPLLEGHDIALATGGALASGKVGIADAQVAAVAATRNFDNFSAYAPPLDAVLYASQSCELRTDGVFREDSTGTAYGPVWVEGDLPRLPVSGLEGRTVQGIVKASRGDFDAVPDTGIDDVSARVFYRPCWLTVPGT